MAEFSDFLEDELIDHVLRNAAYTSPTTVYLALDTTTIVDADTGSTIAEPPTADGYSRQATAFDAPSPAGQTQNTALEAFGPNTNTNWGTILDACITDNATRAAGNMLVFTPLDTSRAIVVDDTLEFAVGAYQVDFQ